MWHPRSTTPHFMLKQDKHVVQNLDVVPLGPSIHNGYFTCFLKVFLVHVSPHPNLISRTRCSFHFAPRRASKLENSGTGKKGQRGNELSVAVASLKYGWEDLQSSVKTSLQGFVNGCLKYCVIVHFWGQQRNFLRVIIYTQQECLFTTLQCIFKDENNPGPWSYRQPQTFLGYTGMILNMGPMLRDIAPCGLR